MKIFTSDLKELIKFSDGDKIKVLPDYLISKFLNPVNKLDLDDVIVIRKQNGIDYKITVKNFIKSIKGLI